MFQLSNAMVKIRYLPCDTSRDTPSYPMDRQLKFESTATKYRTSGSNHLFSWNWSSCDKCMFFVVGDIKLNLFIGGSCMVHKTREVGDFSSTFRLTCQSQNELSKRSDLSIKTTNKSWWLMKILCFGWLIDLVNNYWSSRISLTRASQLRITFRELRMSESLRSNTRPPDISCLKNSAFYDSLWIDRTFFAMHSNTCMTSICLVGKW